MATLVDGIQLDQLTADPVSPPDGYFWYNVTEQQIKICRDGFIVPISAIKSKLDATADPTATDDSTADYEVGSRWVNVSTDAAFLCVDATATAAVWLRLANDVDAIHTGDAAGGDLGGTYPNPTVDDGADGTAIHDNVAGEIAAITLKGTPVSADMLVIEDSAAANAKKRITVGSLPTGGGGSNITIEDEGTPLTTAVTLIDFAGAGVTVTEPVADQVLVTIPGGAAGLSDMPCVSVSNTVTTSGSATMTAITWDTTDLENDAARLEHNNTTTSRIDVKEAGPVLLIASIDAVSTASGIAQYQFYKNGVAIDYPDIPQVQTADAEETVYTIHTIVDCAVNDYLELHWNATGTETIQRRSQFSAMLLKAVDGAAGPPGPAGADGDITWQGAWVSQNYTTNQAVEYNGSSYVCHTNTTASQIPTDTNYWDLMASEGAVGPAATSNKAEATAGSTTTSTIYVAVPGATLTPAAGTYLVWFTGSANMSTKTNSVYMAIALDGTEETSSEVFMQFSSNGEYHAFASSARVTVNGSQAIEGCWKVTGNTTTIHQGVLLILKT